MKKILLFVLLSALIVPVALPETSKPEKAVKEAMKLCVDADRYISSIEEGKAKSPSTVRDVALQYLAKAEAALSGIFGEVKIRSLDEKILRKDGQIISVADLRRSIEALHVRLSDAMAEMEKQREAEATGNKLAPDNAGKASINLMDVAPQNRDVTPKKRSETGAAPTVTGKEHVAQPAGSATKTATPSSPEERARQKEDEKRVAAVLKEAEKKVDSAEGHLKKLERGKVSRDTYEATIRLVDEYIGMVRDDLAGRKDSGAAKTVAEAEVLSHRLKPFLEDLSHSKAAGPEAANGQKEPARKEGSPEVEKEIRKVPQTAQAPSVREGLAEMQANLNALLSEVKDLREQQAALKKKHAEEVSEWVRANEKVGQAKIYLQEELTAAKVKTVVDLKQRDGKIVELEGQIAGMQKQVADKETQLSQVKQVVSERETTIATFRQSVATEEKSMSDLALLNVQLVEEIKQVIAECKRELVKSQQELALTPPQGVRPLVRYQPVFWFAALSEPTRKRFFVNLPRL